MKKIYALFFVVNFALSVFNFCKGQNTFQKIYGVTGDGGYSLKQTIDGGFICLGNTLLLGSGGQEIYLIKIDSIGNLEWAKTYGDSLNDYAWYVIQTPDSGYMISATSNSFGNGENEAYLIKTDENGNVLWSKVYNHNTPHDIGAWCIQSTPDGGYIITGGIAVTGIPISSDVYLLKTDGEGNILWSKNYGEHANFDETAYYIELTSDNGYIIGGSMDGAPLVIKTDSAGDTLWTKLYSLYGSPTAWIIHETFDHGFIISGGTGFSMGTPDCYLLKIDSIGNVLWFKTYGNANLDFGAADVRQTSDSGFIFTGNVTVTAGHNNFYTVKTNSIGDTLWTKTYANAGNDISYSILQTNDGGYMIAGEEVGNGCIYLIKTDSTGNSNCHQSWITTDVANYPVNTFATGLEIQTVNTMEALVITPVNSDANVNILCSSVGAFSPNNNFSFDINLTTHLTTQTLTLSFSSPESANLRLAVTDITGRILLTQPITITPGLNKKEIATGELAKGVYIVTLSGAGGSVSGKVIMANDKY